MYRTLFMMMKRAALARILLASALLLGSWSLLRKDIIGVIYSSCSWISMTILPSMLGFSCISMFKSMTRLYSYEEAIFAREFTSAFLLQRIC